MRTVVVGASSGLGRCIAVGLGQRGAGRAAGPAQGPPRRGGEGGRARTRSPSRATSPTSRRAATRSTRRPTQPGRHRRARLRHRRRRRSQRLVDIDADTWRRTFDTNVIGAALVTAAAIPHLTASAGAAAYLSSVQRVAHAAVARPRRVRREQGGARQAGRGLARRAPEVGFTRVVVGDCGGGEGDAQTRVRRRLGHRARGRVRAGLARPATT